MLGSNVSTVGGLARGFPCGDSWGCECIQVYLTPSRRWDVPQWTPAQLQVVADARQASNVRQVVAHVPFLVNLASPNADVRKKSIRRLVEEVKLATQLDVPYLVLHPGSTVGAPRPAGIRAIAKGLDAVLEATPTNGPMILLETMAGQGSTLGSTFEELSAIMERVKHQRFIGVCFDTAHVFESGYEFRGYDGYDAVIKRFASVVGLDHLKVLHVNDSKTALGSCCDRHAAIGDGQMGLQVFHALVTDTRLSSVPKILEIPERDEKSADCIRLLRTLMARQEPLPGEHRPPEQRTLWGHIHAL